MPYPGYLQDLSQLIEDCLLPVSDIALIDSSHDQKASCSVDLTPSTLEEMLELDKAADPKNEADKATPLHPFTFNYSVSSEDTISISSATQDLLSINFNTPSTIMTPPLSDNLVQPRSEPPARAPPPIPTRLPLDSVTNIVMTPPPSSPSTPAIEVRHPPLMSMTASATAVQSGALSTTLPSRNTEQVIADLKEKRPAASDHNAAELAVKRRLTSFASANSGSTLDDLPEAPVHSGAQDHGNASEDEDESVESSDDEAKQQTARPKKITERKRRLNAAADIYMQERAQKQLKKENKVCSEEQSTRWLVNESEKREIISSPREYQVELFEKAKEKNIIAVLDTGSRSVFRFNSSC